MQPTSLKSKIITSKLDETRDFYQSLLGLEIAEEWNEPGDVGCILAFPDGKREAFLEIYLGNQAPDYSGFSLQFRTADLAGFRDSLPDDVPVRGPTVRPWGSTYLYLTDPNGVAIVIFEGGL